MCKDMEVSLFRINNFKIHVTIKEKAMNFKAN